MLNIHFLKALITKILFISILAFHINTTLYAWEPIKSLKKFGKPFDVNNVIEMVSHNQMKEGEFLINTNVIYDPAIGDQICPSVAFDGANYLVVWSDDREGGYCDIYGARVDQLVNILDPNGIVISSSVGHQFFPKVFFDSINYLVVWYYEHEIHDIYGTRVDQLGNVLDSAGIAISTAYDIQNRPAVAFNGINYLVVWHDDRNGWNNFDIYCTRVDTSGNVLDSAGNNISNAEYDQIFPAIAFDGTNYLIAWADFRANSHYVIYGARVDQSGNVIDTAGFKISTDGYWNLSPSIAFDGTNYLVVWQDNRSDYFYDIYGSRVSKSGNILDTVNIAIATDMADQEVPTIAFDGINYLVVWEEGDNIYGTRVDTSGNVLDSPSIVISDAMNEQGEPSIAYDGINYLVVWTDSRNYYRDIYGTRVNPLGYVLDTAGILISTTTTGIEEDIEDKDAFFVSQCYPNPFMDKTHIEYQLSRSCNVNISIYNTLGAKIRSLLNKRQNAGTYTITWDGRYKNGNKLPDGFYFLRLEADGNRETRKLLLLK